MARRTGGASGLRISPTLRLVLLVLVLVIVAVLLDRAGRLPPAARHFIQTVERVVLGTDILSLPDHAPRRVPPATERIDYAAVWAELASITVLPERRRGYRREDWPHWLPVRRCINTRDQVLIDESLDSVVLSQDGCAVVSGRWHDPYIDQDIRDPKRLDIDHMVPLEEAFASGGHDWPRDKRAAFANDRTDPRTLVAVLGEVNRAKGAKGPEEWLPPNKAYQCRYVADWIAVKAHWRLGMDESERVAVGNIVNACQRAQVARREGARRDRVAATMTGRPPGRERSHWEG